MARFGSKIRKLDCIVATSLSEKLVNLATDCCNDDSRLRAADHLLDWLGVVLAGAQTKTGTLFLNTVPSRACGPCFTPKGFVNEARSAAFANGALGNILELDDVHRLSILHAGDVVIPASLALAQQQNAPAKELLNALVIGYEVAIRIGVVAAQGGYSSWYNSGTCGVFGAAAACAHLLGLCRQGTVDALGQAGMMASGLWQCRLEPTLSKQVATAHAAEAGVRAAELAQLGIKGPRFILEGELGFFKTLYPNAVADDVVAGHDVVTGSGKALIHDVSFKPWPACRHVHPAIEAALSLSALLNADEITHITVETYQAALAFCDNPNPSNAHEARFSLQHGVAASLLHGPPFLSHASTKMRVDADVARLRACVKVKEDRQMTALFPKAYQARVIIEAAGKTVQAEIHAAKGDPENPMSAGDLKTKFHMLAEGCQIEDAQITQLCESVLSLNAQETMDRMTRALQVIQTSGINPTKEFIE